MRSAVWRMAGPRPRFRHSPVHGQAHEHTWIKRVETHAAAAPMSHADIRSILIGIMLAMFLAALDQTIVATAMPTIGRELNDVAHLPWVVTAYLLASTAVTPLYGKLADIHGRRVVLLSGIVVFILGSVACALAPTLWLLVVARFVQGLGGGGLIALAQTIIADMVPPKERGKYQVYIASVFFVSSLLGPVLGGVIAEALHWSVIFWINLPLGLAAYWMTSSALKRLPRHERPHKLDVLGAAADHQRDDDAAAGPVLGRHALSLGLGADPRPGRCCRPLLWLAFAWRLQTARRAADPARPSWPTRWCATAPSPPASAWARSSA